MSRIARQLTSGSALRVMSFSATAIVSLAITPLVVHSLGDRLYGFWALVSTFIGYYGLLDLGMSTAVSQHIALDLGRGDHQRCNAVINDSLRILLGIGALALLASVALSVLAPAICATPADALLFRKVILILGMSVAVSFPARAFTGALTANLQYSLISVLDMLSLLLRTVFIILALRAGYRLVALAWITLLSNLPSIALQIYFTRRALPWLQLRPSHKLSSVSKSLFSYSTFAFVTQVSDRLRYQADPVVITLFIGLVALSHYRIASLLAEQFILLVVAVVGVFQPLFTKLHGQGDEPGLGRAFLFATKVSVCVSTLVCFGMIAWGKPFIYRWMGPSYVDAYPPLVVLASATTFALWQTPSVDMFYSIAMHRYYAYINVAEGVLNLAFSLILVRRLGVLGVALGTFCAMGIMRLIIQPVVLCRVAKFPYPAYLRTFLSSVSWCALLAGGIYPFVRWGMEPYIAPLLGSAVLCTCLYAIGCFYLVFNRVEREKWVSGLFRAVPDETARARQLA